MKEIIKLLKSHDIDPENIVLFQENRRVQDYLIDGKYLLRFSKSPLDEVEKLQRVEVLEQAPKVYATGIWPFQGQETHYMICDYFQGKDLFSALPDLTEADMISLGREIILFLDDLHKITDDSYDIGHYVPTIPRTRKTWRQGHEAYMETLKESLVEFDLDQASRTIIDTAFAHMKANLDCLDTQLGARLLHNDLHPKNIIVKEGKLAGIIDWECAQFGEPDFELAHLVHWSLYPPEGGVSFAPLLKEVLAPFARRYTYEVLEKRLTLYQLEHELNQLVWNGKKQLAERIPRLEGWLNHKIGDLLL